MDYRVVILIGGVVGSALIASMGACSGPDPGAITYGERQSSNGGEPQGSSTSSSSSSGSAIDAGGVSGHPIFEVSAMQWVDPGVQANNPPSAAGKTAHGPTVDGKDCMVAGCHLDTAPIYAFAGTLYTTAQGTGPVAKGEVRVVDSKGVEVGRAYTDTNGNFWLEKAGGIPANSKTGVRKEGGSSPQVMSLTLASTDQGCSANRANCHGSLTVATGKVFVP